MKISFKISDSLKQKIMADLRTPHQFAAERVGFIGCKVAGLPNNGLILLANDYWPVADEDYLKDFSVGAMMGPAAIRKALQVAYTENISMFHVHLHDHRGIPKFSRVDMSAKFHPHCSPNCIPECAAVASCANQQFQTRYPVIA